TYALAEPLVLPRETRIHLVGEGVGSVLQGSANFPEGRGLVEWEPVKAQAFQQRISGLRFNLPDVAGVMAIHYQPTAKATVTDVQAEWMQVDMTNCWFYGRNTYHERFVHLEGGARVSRFEHLIGEPALDAAGYNTLLLEFEYTAPQGYLQGADAHGLFGSVIRQCVSMFSRGGKSAALRGRFLQCDITDTFCDGGSDTPCFDLADSSSVTLRGLATEGRNEQPQYRFTRCDFITGQNIGIGTPDDYYGTGLGDG